MANKDVILHDDEENDLYPVTRTSNVYDSSNHNLDELLAGKQASLSTAQQNAVNSGVTSSTVAQVSTNTSNISQLSNPNLLINGDFRVNQRGQASYSGSDQYSVDRWKITSSGTLVPNNDGSITITTSSSQAYLVQRIEDTPCLWGKTITISAKLGDGTFFKKTFTLPNSAPNSGQSYGVSGYTNGVEIRLYYYVGKTLAFTFDIEANKTVTILYAKLEIGSVATPFNPRPYAEELTACQMPAPEDSGMSTIFSNPNLLINGDFNINQRGESSYNNTNAGHNKYTVDRWVHYNNDTYTLKQNTGYGITFSATGSMSIDLAQLIEDGYNIYNGKTLTASAKVDGIIYSVTYTVATNTSSNVKFYQSGIESGRLVVECTSGNKLKVWLRVSVGKTLVIDYVKLELGSVATPYSPRPYAEELAMCQRYYQVNRAFKLSKSTYNFYEPYLSFKTEMRVAPTIIGVYAVTGGGVVSSNDKTYYEIATNTEISASTNPYGYQSKYGLVLSNGSGTFTADKQYQCQVTCDAEIY